MSFSKELTKELERLEKALLNAVQFMTQVIEEDTEFMSEYYKKYGDLRYRKKKSPWGKWDFEDEPMEIDIPLKAETLGLALKRIVDTLAVLNLKLDGVGVNKKSFEDSEFKDEGPSTLTEKAAKILEKAESTKKRSK